MRTSKNSLDAKCRKNGQAFILMVFVACCVLPVPFSRSRLIPLVSLNLPRAPPDYEFVTFAFTANAGGRWTPEACRRAIRLTYSSLVRSQHDFPRLHVFTDVASIIPNRTTMGTRTDIVVHIGTPNELPRNQYTGKDAWKSLSRAKLDVVEQLILSEGKKMVWVDLDTLVFADLGVTNANSWLIGYQNGGCNGARNCSWEQTANGGESQLEIEPKFDALGDLWSLDLHAIAAVRQYEAEHMRRGLPLPKYDLQGYFSFMLQDQEMPAVLLHDILEYNFGFFCSNFKHPSSGNMELRVLDGDLTCPRRPNVNMSERVGAVSFTAPTFQELLLPSDVVALHWVKDQDARIWLEHWFSAL